jgi:hypothetical protein
MQEEEGKGHYHAEDLVERCPNGKRHLRNNGDRRDDAPQDTKEGSSSSDGSVPSSPTDPALKKPDELTVADKWKLAAEHFVLEGGLSIGFHMQRSKGTLMLPEKLQPWNRNSWQRQQLDDLLSTRANKQKGKTSGPDQERGKAIHEDHPIKVEDVSNPDLKNLLKAAAIADNPSKAEKWKCLEELVWLQHGSNKILQHLQARESGDLDFTGMEHLDPDRDDSFGPDVMEQLHQLRTALIRKRIDEDKRGTFDFPPLVKRTSEDERQEILNYFRPIGSRIKTGGLPTPFRPTKDTTPSPTREHEAEHNEKAGSDHGEEKHDQSEEKKDQSWEKQDRSEEKVDQRKDKGSQREEWNEAATQGKTTEEGSSIEEAVPDQNSGPARKALQGDDDLLHYSDEDELFYPEALKQDHLIPGHKQKAVLSKLLASGMGKHSARIGGKGTPNDPNLRNPSASPSPACGSLPQKTTPEDDFLYEDEFSDCSLPPLNEEQLADLAEREEHLRLVDRPTRGDDDSTAERLNRNLARPDRDRSRSRSRSPRKEEASKREREFRVRTASPRRSSPKPLLLMEDDVGDI